MWRLEGALCRDLTPAQSNRIFFPKGNVPRIAREFCAACPVREACLAEALEVEARLPASYRVGFRAGTTPAQRHALSQVAV